MGFLGGFPEICDAKNVCRVHCATDTSDLRLPASLSCMSWRQSSHTNKPSCCLRVKDVGVREWIVDITMWNVKINEQRGKIHFFAHSYVYVISNPSSNMYLLNWQNQPSIIHLKELIFLQINMKGCESNLCVFSCLFRKQYNKIKTKHSERPFSQSLGLRLPQSRD